MCLNPDPSPERYPNMCSDTNPNPVLNPDLYVNSSPNADSKFITDSDPNLNSKLDMDEEIIEEKSAFINCSRDETRILKFGTPMAPFSGNCNEGIESISCGFNLHPNPDINPDPSDVYHKSFHTSS